VSLRLPTTNAAKRRTGAPSNGTAYISDWARVESMDEPGVMFAMPQRAFHHPNQIGKALRQLSP
jgi:hypothetical protein